MPLILAILITAAGLYVLYSFIDWFTEPRYMREIRKENPKEKNIFKYL